MRFRASRQHRRIKRCGPGSTACLSYSADLPLPYRGGCAVGASEPPPLQRVPDQEGSLSRDGGGHRAAALVINFWSPKALKIEKGKGRRKSRGSEITSHDPQ